MDGINTDQFEITAFLKPMPPPKASADTKVQSHYAIESDNRLTRANNETKEIGFSRKKSTPISSDI